MQFDDRLATVLVSAPSGDAARRTQLRQLVDLLGTMSGREQGGRVTDAYARLDELLHLIPGAVQSAIIREPGLRLRNPVLVAHLASSEPQAAAAAMATARLTEQQWIELIPRIPMIARGFLRHRRDLPPGAAGILRQLGVQDLVLPQPANLTAQNSITKPQNRPQPALAPAKNASDWNSAPGIASIVRRIEDFQRTRREDSGIASGLNSERLDQKRATAQQFDFATDAAGVICWADALFAPVVVGLPLVRRPAPSLLAAAQHMPGPLPDIWQKAMRLHQPVSAAMARLEGPASITGEWHMDAAPVFCPVGGAFTGYRGRMRRPAPPGPAAAQGNSQADRVRQLLHELRTPVGAIQGFAEIIQQQLFGPAPNEYRALAAAVAVDAARLLGGFDDMDRLARLETASLPLTPGVCDLRTVVEEMLKRLEGVLRPRSARIDVLVSGTDFAVPLHRDDAQLIMWRLLASVAGAMSPGEIVLLHIRSAANDTVRLECELPAAMAHEGDIFAATRPAQARAISAGMFGTGFTLRLALAETRAANGLLERSGDILTLSLPLAMHKRTTQATGDEADGGMTAA